MYRLSAFGLATILLLVLASASGAVADSDRGPVGSWLGTATATTAPLPPVMTLMTLASDGTVVEVHRQYLHDFPLGPALVTPGHGAWVRTGSNQFSISLRLIYEGAPDNSGSAGVVVATEVLRLNVSLSAGGNRLTGTVADELDDLSGHAIFVGPGTFDATRITAP